MLALGIGVHATRAVASGTLAITSTEPGNIFVAGQPVVFNLSGNGSIRYECMDFWGRQILSGEHSGDIELPLSRPGWYEIACSDSLSTSTISFGIVPSRASRVASLQGRVCCDTACSVLVGGADHARFAQIAALSGVAWVRERCHWADTEPRPGIFDWTKYDDTIECLHAAGLHIVNVFHFSPSWARRNNPAGMAPDDLRDAYRWAKEAARRYDGKVEAWEIWNEEDLESSWRELPDRYAATEKAFYLGFKDGSPACRVLIGAIAMDPANTHSTERFVATLYQSGISSYFDLFNWHHYDHPEALGAALASHRAELRANGAAIRPAWITESGITSRAKGLLSRDLQVRQAQYMGPSVACSLAAGNEKNFYFVMPNYLEGSERQYGTLKPDLTPYPSYVALAGAASILGQACFAGHYPLGDGIESLLFSTPSGNVLCLWSDKVRAVSLPFRQAAAKDLFGAATSLSTVNGRLSVDVGPNIIYLTGFKIPRLPAGARSDSAIAKPACACRTVLAGLADLPSLRAKSAYLVSPGKPFAYSVQVYNFDQGKRSFGHISVRAPKNWLVSPASATFGVGPMGRQRYVFEITPPVQMSLGFNRIMAVATANEQPASPSASFVLPDVSKQAPLHSVILPVSDQSKWDRNISANGTIATRAVDAGVRFEAHFDRPGDRWFFPGFRVDKGMSLAQSDGVSLDLETETPDRNATFRVMMEQPNGSIYTETIPAAPTKRHVVLLFKDLEWGGFSPPAPNGRLDLSTVTSVRFGANTTANSVELEITDLQAVRFSFP
jgi:hypothetical protein